MKWKFISVTISRNVSVIFLQVHIHLDNSNQKKKQRTDLWNSSSAKKQGTGLGLVEAYATVQLLLSDLNKRKQLKTSQFALLPICELGVLWHIMECHCRILSGTPPMLSQMLKMTLRNEGLNRITQWGHTPDLSIYKKIFKPKWHSTVLHRAGKP